MSLSGSRRCDRPAHGPALSGVLRNFPRDARAEHRGSVYVGLDTDRVGGSREQLRIGVAVNDRVVPVRHRDFEEPALVARVTLVDERRGRVVLRSAPRRVGVRRGAGDVHESAVTGKSSLPLPIHAGLAGVGISQLRCDGEPDSRLVRRQLHLARFGPVYDLDGQVLHGGQTIFVLGLHRHLVPVVLVGVRRGLEVCLRRLEPQFEAYGIRTCCEVKTISVDLNQCEVGRVVSGQ